MRVLFTSMAPFMGGAEVAGERLCSFLHERDIALRALIGTDGEMLARLRSAGVDCEHAPMYLTDRRRPLRYLWARRALRRQMSAWRPDVVHSNDLPTHQMVSDAARGLGIPRICHHRFFYDGAAIDWMNKFGAEHHVFISNHLQRHLCERSRALAGASGTVVHDGLPIPERPTPETRAELRSSLGLAQERRVVLFVGQIVPIKGVEDLLRAWAALGHEHRTGACLVLVGEDMQTAGRYRREMEQLGEQLGCEARFVGFQQRPQDWFAAADVAVTPSRAEPFGLVVLEAMAAGLPVIGADTGGIPEMLVDGETGVLFPPGDVEALTKALDLMLSEPERRAEHGRAGRTRLEAQFGIERHGERILALYREFSVHPAASSR